MELLGLCLVSGFAAKFQQGRVVVRGIRHCLIDYLSLAGTEKKKRVAECNATLLI